MNLQQNAIAGINVHVVIDGMVVARCPRCVVSFDRYTVTSYGEIDVPDPEGALMQRVKPGQPVSVRFGYASGGRQCLMDAAELAQSASSGRRCLASCPLGKTAAQSMIWRMSRVARSNGGHGLMLSCGTACRPEVIPSGRGYTGLPCASAVVPIGEPWISPTIVL